MANVLSNDRKQQVIALGQLGWPLRRIEQATGVRRETASKYLREAGVPVRAPGAWGRRPPEPNPAKQVSTDPEAVEAPAEAVLRGAEAKPAKHVSTDLEVAEAAEPSLPPPPPRPERSPQASACEPYREFIELGLRRGRNAVAIYQDLVTSQGFEGAYASVRRFVRKLRGGSAQDPEAHGTILTAPGEEAQVDYGEGPMVRNPATGKFVRTRLFVLTLGFSRKSIRLLTFNSSARIWAELHEVAFRRLGGTPRVVVLDNLREGVIRPDFFDPELNPLFRDVLKHYGVVALPCRVRDPDRKGKVESSIGHTQRTPLKGLRFEAMPEAQEYLDQWDRRWADTRIHGTTKRQVAAMFEEERPALQPLPPTPFRYYKFGERTVHIDGYVEIDGAYYAAPPGMIGQRVFVQWDVGEVRLLDVKTSQLLREYLPQVRGKHRIRDVDRQRKTPPTTQALLTRAAFAGRSIGALCEAIHRRDQQEGVRRILGVLSLVKKNGAPAVDKACAVALEMGIPTYRFVSRYLEHHPPVQLTLRQIDPLIRELTYYRDVINRRTGEEA